nr:T6SS immunity protein Tli4 family protein [uncultured Aquabacterium sp.]
MNSPRIDKLFEKTKPVCFGRFVIDVPDMAVIAQGPQAFGPRIESLPNDAASLATKAKAMREVVQAKARTIDRAEVISLSPGPTKGSWVLRYWESDTAKEVGLQNATGFLVAGPHGFIYPDETGDNESPEDLQRNIAYVAKHLRARDPKEAPPEPGVCLDVGFIADDTGRFQEIFGIGLRFPDLPDVSFSVSSNKNAQQGDSFEDRRAEAKRAAFLVAPMATLFNKVKTLREGKLKVQQGEGSEALFRRPQEEGGGAWHEFQFEYAGKRFDHRNPSWDASLFTGVAHNQAGSKPSSLTDEEAMALWDRLMSSVRLRVPAKP